MAKKKVLVDVEIICEPPSHTRWFSALENQAKEMESWIKEFHEFIRDHRSQDPVNLEVRRIYEDRCEFCQRFWEVGDDGCPICCDEAVKEWDNSRAEHKLQLEA
ncbi:MAG: hypothetical protein WC554_16205 [Clostridia bacterium]